MIASRREIMRPSILCILVAVLTIAANSVSAQNRRQPCPGSYNPATWNRCFGEATFPHGQNYVGEFRDGKPHGQGAMSYPGSNKYVGEWRNGKRDGEGTMWYPIGHQYAGEWRDNRRNGQGTMSYPDGRKYVGGWKNGKRSGQGTEYGQDGSILRSGAWKDGNLVRSSH